MAEKNPPLHLQQRTDHTAEGDRQLLDSIFNSTEGILRPDDLEVTQSGTPGMSVQVAAGTALVKGDENSLQGLYHVWNDAAATLVISAADATNPRRDIIVARVRDAYYSGVTNAWALEVLTGTPAASPSDPTVPDNCLPLARVAVAALASSITNANITDLRTPARPWHQAWGVVGAAESSSTSGSITTETDLTGMSVTFDSVAGRKYAIHWSVNLQSTVVTDNIRTLLHVDGVQKTLQIHSLFAAGAAQRQTGSYLVEGTGSSMTTKLRALRSSGSGTVTMTNSATNLSLIWVEDVGPA